MLHLWCPWCQSYSLIKSHMESTSSVLPFPPPVSIMEKGRVFEEMGIPSVPVWEGIWLEGSAFPLKYTHYFVHAHRVVTPNSAPLLCFLGVDALHRWVSDSSDSSEGDLLTSGRPKTVSAKPCPHKGNSCPDSTALCCFQGLNISSGPKRKVSPFLPLIIEVISSDFTK